MSVDKSRSIDEIIEEEARKGLEELWPEFKAITRPPYKEGDLVKVKINNIVSFGAFCFTVDKHQYPGLIHIASIANTFIENIEDYVRPGDEFEAKVKHIKYDNNKKMYQVEFSLLHLNLVPKNSNPFLKLSNLKDQLPERPKETDNKVIYVQRNLETESNQPITLYMKYPKDIRNILTYIANMCGILSSESEQRVLEMVEKHGIFLFTKALIEAKEEFKPDLSHYLLNEVEKKIGDGL